TVPFGHKQLVDYPPDGVGHTEFDLVMQSHTEQCQGHKDEYKRGVVVVTSHQKAKCQIDVEVPVAGRLSQRVGDGKHPCGEQQVKEVSEQSMQNSNPERQLVLDQKSSKPTESRSAKYPGFEPNYELLQHPEHDARPLRYGMVVCV